MIIKSYLAYPVLGKLLELTHELQNMSACEVTPAENQELVILVTESESEALDESLYSQLQQVSSLQSLTLVAGLNESVAT